MKRWSLVASLTLLAPAPALAQAEGDAPVDEAPAEVAASQDAYSKADFPRISDNQETIYAVQRKAFLVNRKIELTLNPASTAFTDRFVQTFGFGGGVGYHIAENFGIELHGVYLFPFDSDLTTEILDEGKLTPEAAKLTQMRWGATAGVEWTPIYGKIEIFDKLLGNFGVYDTAGFGLGQSRVECTINSPLDQDVFPAPSRDQPRKCEPDPDRTKDELLDKVYEPDRLHAMVSIGGGIRFFFADFIGLRVEVRDWLFPARVFRPGTSEDEATQKFTDAIRNNVFFNIGVSFLFGGED